MEQLSLMDVLDAYTDEQQQSNTTMYKRVGMLCGIPAERFEDRTPVGKDGTQHSVLKRRVRWHQNTLKSMGLLEPVAGRRGEWSVTQEGRRTLAKRMQQLEPSAPGIVQLGFSTALGCALWADCRDGFKHLEEEVHAIITSPPYPLAVPRDYGNPSRDEYVDWLCACLEPAVKKLAPGGSLFLGVSNEIFMPKSPARSLYRQRMVIALYERLGLSCMDQWIWHNPTKAPGPFQWASKKRVQLNAAWEPIYFFTNDPDKCFADNRRVLKPHTEAHKRFVAAGGAGSAAVFGDGANRRVKGAFSTPTEGAIPRNVLTIPHRCPSQLAMRKWATANGVPMHSATMPLELAELAVKFATEEGMLIADLFSGWGTTAFASEKNNRRWYVTERMRAYLHAHQWRMQQFIHSEAGIHTDEILSR